VSGLRFWIGIGANLGDRAASLAAAVRSLAAAGIVIERVSSAYETAPRDLDDQPPFLNAALRARSPLDPPHLLDVAKRIERDMGRDLSGVRFGPRVIDCDLLLWEGGVWSDRRLEIPHPRLAERRFALVPLLEIDPDLSLPDGVRLSDLERALDPEQQPVRPAALAGWPPRGTGA
jgi:2-amino-4-hydroxy-6-hydroxymethyldihydropteridine diphosphokinase